MLKYLIWQQTKIKLKQWQNIFHVTANANSIAQHVIQIKNGIIKHVNVSVKIIVSAKKIIARILVHAFVKIASIVFLLIISGSQISAAL